MTPLQSAIETRMEKLFEREQEARYDSFVREMDRMDELALQLAEIEASL